MMSSLTEIGIKWRLGSPGDHQYQLFTDWSTMMVILQVAQYRLERLFDNLRREIRHVSGRCIWMTVNKLRLNDSKTEVLLFGPKVPRNRLHLDSLMVGDSEICVPITGSIRNLGAYFDSDLSMNAHVTKVCQTIHFHLRNIGKVRKYLDFDTTTILVHSLVTSRLDYCNSLLLGVPKQTLNRLQMLGSLLCQSGEIMFSLSLSLFTGFH